VANVRDRGVRPSTVPPAFWGRKPGTTGAGLLPPGGAGSFPGPRPRAAAARARPTLGAAPTTAAQDAPLPIPYRLIRAPLFGLPPELSHRIATTALRGALAPPAVRGALSRALAVDEPALRVRRWGIDFPNPVGLAAGFDKSGASFNALAALGFGFVEIGTVTAEPQPGNPLPRLFRLPADRALLNRMGFNNPGAEAVARRLGESRIDPILGINLGKSKVAPLERATEDYLRSFELLEPFARYLVVNVSSPNTPGLRELQDARPLRQLLGTIVRAARARAGGGRPPCPVLVKLAPDLTDPQIDEAVEIAMEEGASGIVAVNTTVSRAGLATPAERVEALGAGGISGPPLRARAQAVVGRIHRRTAGAVPIVGVGGIETAEHAWDRIRAGASLIQVYTGLVYQGPGMVRRINLGLRRLLEREGCDSLEQVVGSASR
jgi:dihydroorotate dehydrogenase